MLPSHTSHPFEGHAQLESYDDKYGIEGLHGCQDHGGVQGSSTPLPGFVFQQTRGGWEEVARQ